LKKKQEKKIIRFWSIYPQLDWGARMTGEEKMFLFFLDPRLREDDEEKMDSRLRGNDE